MHSKANKQIRSQLKSTNIPFWLLAEKIGVHESTIIRWFRTELNDRQTALVHEGIKSIISEREDSL